MAIDPDTVGAAISTQLSTITGMNVRDFMPEQIETPMAISYLDTPVEFDQSMGRGLDKFVWSVAVIVSRADSETAQKSLRDYCASSGSLSVKTALEAATGSFKARTLGGSVHTCRVTEVKDIGVMEVAGLAYLFAEFTLETFG